MTKQERDLLIDSYGKAYDTLVEGLEKFPEEMWKWKPAPDKWSIHEIMVHITDSEANSYIRCRRFVAEPGSGVYGYDQDAWAVQLNYHNQSVSEALELFKLLRKASYNLIKDLPEELWQTATVHHSEMGKVTFEEWLKIYEEHIPVHLLQMKRNLAAWQAVKPS